MTRGTCEVCGQPVLTTDRAAFRVRGWEVEREQGGANTILGRERQPDRIAHAACIKHRLRHGDQDSLLG